ncbi:hypothetical protein E2C01_092824 [Portunus trituberculatus]|uniref:Uncharacterized protein n=1 Tax=Portunus trituberculatus TaxID=210409 RepID=A0A5B7JT85_PORTR|nr:hypothetical protein [Portunus trituberculatus]
MPRGARKSRQVAWSAELWSELLCLRAERRPDITAVVCELSLFVLFPLRQLRRESAREVA